MPELPEVETVVRSIRPHITGHTIERAEVRSVHVTRQDFRATERALNGAKIEGVSRHGKQIHIALDRGVLYVHLGMTGALLWNAEEDKFAHAVLHLDNGTLIYRDVRQLGRFEFYAEFPDKSRKGPDALSVPFDVFYKRLQKHRGAIKTVLLSQSFIAGVGNIYADEILFASGVNPKTLANRISKTRAERIHKHTLEILAAAVEMRGSSISNYVDAEGERGDFQSVHQVYGREGLPCPRCKRAIRRIVLGQRSAHYCPNCQK